MYLATNETTVISETGRSNEVIGIRDGFLDRVDIAGRWEMGKIWVAIRKVGRATQVKGTVNKVIEATWCCFKIHF